MHLISKSVELVARKLIRSPRNQLLRRYQQQVSIPYEQTVTGRIYQYLNIESAQNGSDSTPTLVQKFHQNSKQLYKLDNYELLSLSSSLTHKSLTQNEALLMLKELDREYSRRAPQFNTTNILKLLNIYMCIIPRHITDFKFFHTALVVLADNIPSLSKKDLLQLMFYTGLRKKSEKTQLIHRTCIKYMSDPFIESLTKEELCIICNATFRTATKILNKKLLDRIRQYINDDVSLLQDSALCVTLLKTLRQNKAQDEDLLNTISHTIFFNRTFVDYHFIVYGHIMALFADYFYYDRPLYKLFVEQCLEQISKEQFDPKSEHSQIRVKDIQTFVWIVSMFSELKLINHSSIKDVIVPKLLERVGVVHLADELEYLLDIFFYLWILNYRAYELVPLVFNNRTSRLQAPNSKSNLRLNLLLHAINIEDNDLFKEIGITPVKLPTNCISSYQLRKRPLVHRILNTLENLRDSLAFNKFELSQEISHLNIVGITGFKNENKSVYIEILDDYNRMKNVEDDIPVGLMALKLRLLDQSNEGVVVVGNAGIDTCYNVLQISQKEVEEMTNAELKEYLFDEIKLVC